MGVSFNFKHTLNGTTCLVLFHKKFISRFIQSSPLMSVLYKFYTNCFDFMIFPDLLSMHVKISVGLSFYCQDLTLIFITKKMIWNVDLLQHNTFYYGRMKTFFSISKTVNQKLLLLFVVVKKPSSFVQTVVRKITVGTFPFIKFEGL